LFCNDEFVSESIYNFHIFCYLHSNVFACNFAIEENCGHVFTRGGCKYVSPTHTVENVTPICMLIIIYYTIWYCKISCILKYSHNIGGAKNENFLLQYWFTELKLFTLSTKLYNNIDNIIYQILIEYQTLV